MKNKIIIYLLCVFAINVYFWPEETQVETINEQAILPQPFIITFDGDVAYPGSYTFYSSITLRDALEYAGGITNDESAHLVNYNEIINTNKSFVFKTNEVSDPEYLGPFNLNEISTSDLMNLVGVIKGLTSDRAINIIIYRQNNGLFTKIDDLLKVRGIGPASYEQLSPYFKV